MAQFSIDDLELAFCMHMVDQIVSADDELSPEEIAFLDRQFPIARLRARGFVDADGLRTETWQEAAMQALERLPAELSTARKLEILSLFLKATVVDADFEVREGNVLVDGARLLDLDDAVIDDFLARHAETGGKRLGDLDG